MSQHFEDGRLWAVDRRTGQKRRALPHIIAMSQNLSLAPSERAKDKRVQLREPKPAPPVTLTEPATAPTPDFEPDNPTSEPATTPTNTPIEESS